MKLAYLYTLGILFFIAKYVYASNSDKAIDAIKNGNVELFQKSFEKNLRLKDRFMGNTLLHLAAKHGQTEIA